MKHTTPISIPRSHGMLQCELDRIFVKRRKRSDERDNSTWSPPLHSIWISPKRILTLRMFPSLPCVDRAADFELLSPVQAHVSLLRKLASSIVSRTQQES